MASSKDESVELSDVQKVLTAKNVNVTFLKKVKLEKSSKKYLAISTNRVFTLAAKSPHKIENSFHILEIQSIESVKQAVVQIKFTNEKHGVQVITSDQDQDTHFIVAHLVALLRYNFPGFYREKSLKLKVEPSERLEKILKLSEALTSSTTESEIGPCGGFSLSYASICDLYGQVAMAEVMWDIDKIYGSHGCKEFNISDFDHLETKELIPVIATFEYNTWFKSFSCKSYRLGSELVDVLVKVLKTNSSIEGLDLFDCRLQKESLQKLFQAIASNTKTALKKLNFGKNTIEDKGTSTLCTAITSLPHGLEALLLHDMNISAKGASSICSALKGNKFMSSTLSSLNLSSNPLKSDGSSAVCELLAHSNVLRELDVSNSECSLELVFGAVARGCLLHLKSLNLSGNPYSYRKAKDTQIVPSVNKFFSSCLVLEDVNLSNTKISPEAVKAVLVGLISNTVVKDVSLDLSRNDLRSAGAAEVSSCIAGVANVTSLDLTDNGLDMDLVALCQNIQKNKSLKHLNLGQNIGKSKSVIVPSILESIVEMSMSKTLPLTSLSLADCRLRQDAGIFIDSLGTNETLQKLDISGNFIGDEGARLLAKALQINTKLRNLNLDRNGITLKGFNSIATALERNYSLQLVSTPFSDISQLLKHSGDGISTCFKKIEQLLLRNQSTEHNDQDHSLRLKQNLLLNSLDQESTDVLLVKVQDSIIDLQDVENDETVTKEVEIGKESIKDADKMKQVLFKMFVEIGNHSKEIEERTSKLTKEMIDFANELVKKNISQPLDILKDQCPSIAANQETMDYLEEQISSKGMVDSLGVKESIARTVVGQISNKVTEATLFVASAFAEHLTDLMQDNLTRSKIKLNFLSMEYQEKQKNELSQKKDGSLPSPVDEKDESILAVQKAKNRISTQGRHSQLLPEEGSKNSKVKRRPTFIRSKDAGSFVEIEISMDDSPSEASKEPDEPQPKIVVTAEPKEDIQGDGKNETTKEDGKSIPEKTITQASSPKQQNEDQPRKGSFSAKPQQNEDQPRKGSFSAKPQEIEDQPRKGSFSAKPQEIEDQPRKGSFSTKPQEIEDQPKKGSLPAKPQEIEDQPRKGSFSAKTKIEKPKVDKSKVHPKPRPKSGGSFDVYLGTNPERHLSESGLVHLNKGRARPAKGRRPPSKASGLAHLNIDGSLYIKDDLPSPESEDSSTKSELRTPPKPRPKSLQPMDTAGIDHDTGVIRSGSISNSPSTPIKPKSSKPDVEAKPEPPKKENSIKKPRVPIGIPMPGMPRLPGLFKKDKSPSIKRKEETSDSQTSEPTGKGKDDNTERETEVDKAEHEEPVPKPKPKAYKPPGGVPFLGGAMGLGGQLMAEMKKKQHKKEEVSHGKETREPGKTSPKVAPKALKPSLSAKKPPPPAKLSNEKRKSLIFDSGAKPVLANKPDRSLAVPNKETESKKDEAVLEKEEPIDSVDGAKASEKEKQTEKENEKDSDNITADVQEKTKSGHQEPDSKEVKDESKLEKDGENIVKINDSDNKTETPESNNNNNTEMADDSTL